MYGRGSRTGTGPVSQPNRAASRRRAAVGVFVVVALPVLLGMAALTVDVGYLYLVRQELQMSADAGAVAGVWSLYDENGNEDLDAAQSSASNYAAMNSAAGAAQIEFGWIQDPFDPASPFIPVTVGAINSIQVTSRRESSTGNPVSMFFASIFGVNESDVSARAVTAFSPVSALDGVPVALRAPTFAPVDPTVVAANPGKDGPSQPLNGWAFQIGEKVTLFAYGKGKKSPVHLVLNTNDIPGEAQLGKVLRGEDPPVPLAVGDEVDVMGEGTGHNGLGVKLADRLDDTDTSNDTIIVPVVEELAGSRNDKGELDGNVRIVDFVAVHLDAVESATVPDPNDPQDNGKTIDIELLVGTIVQRAVSGTGASTTSGVVDGTSVGVPLLIR